jgi:hypothetical protein
MKRAIMLRVTRVSKPALLLVAAAVLALGLAACSSNKKAATTSTSAPPVTDQTVTTPADSILTGKAQQVTFAQAKRAIVQLYAKHPEIRSFNYQDVVYTPETRDKVLAVCKQGGPASNPRERETSRVFGCAPLIFFFYNYGHQKSVAESIAVARKLFWYSAEIKGPFAALPPLTDLLQRWGVQ